VFQAALAGFLAGFVGSMPVAGPIAVLVVARSLQDRVREAILIGVGAAIPEAAYAFLAYWGFASFLADTPLLVPISRAVGALILIFLSFALVRYRPPSDPDLAPVPVSRGGAGSFFLGFTIAALNPTLIVTWAAVLSLVASLDLLEMEPALALPFSAAAAVGMAAWCVLMAGAIARFRERLSQDMLVRVHRGMAVLVFGLAVVFVVAFFDCL
jgi:threonine/homoserine/homoserine lactone efflux protein